MWRLFSIWIVLTQIYWLPGLPTAAMTAVKFSGFVVFVLHTFWNSREFKSNIPVLLLISSSALVSLDVFSKLLLIWTIGSMIRVHNSKTFVDIPLPLVGLFLLPSLGYVVPWIRTIPVPLQYFETHYRWLDFWEYGWNGVSTGYGYSLFFLLTQLWQKERSKARTFLVCWTAFAVVLTGSALSLVFSSLFLFTRFFRFSLFIEAAALVAMIAVVPRDTLLDLGNSRFEQYPELLKIDWVDVLFSGRENEIINEHKFHNGFLSTIIEYGLFGVVVVAYATRGIWRNLSKHGMLNNTFILIVLYNFFEPSNIFGNWSSLIPFWFIFFIQKQAFARSQQQDHSTLTKGAMRTSIS